MMSIAVNVAVAAPASSVTPVGYRTNLTVYGPGGDRAADYLRFGLPLHMLLAVITILLVPAIWPLHKAAKVGSSGQKNKGRSAPLIAGFSLVTRNFSPCGARQAPA